MTKLWNVAHLTLHEFQSLHRDHGMDTSNQ